jgi:cbb3-type cytochrome oxidase maturation protein
MTALLWLLPAALFLGLLGLAAFIWSLRAGQYDDLDGTAQRILHDGDGPRPSYPGDSIRPVSGSAPVASPQVYSPSPSPRD